MNSYELSRQFFDWSYENTDIIKPSHVALYFFIIEHNNRLGWKEKFGLPLQMSMDAIGISNYKTYAKAFKDLVDWNFIKVFQKSKNQYSATVIGLVKNTKANTKALTKASLKHSTKQVRDTALSTVGIDKPNNSITLEPNNKEQIQPPTILEFLEFVELKTKEKFEEKKFAAEKKFEAWVENGWKDGNDKPIKNWKSKILNTIPYLNSEQSKKINNGASKPGNAGFNFDKP